MEKDIELIIENVTKNSVKTFIFLNHTDKSLFVGNTQEFPDIENSVDNTEEVDTIREIAKMTAMYEHMGYKKEEFLNLI